MPPVDSFSRAQEKFIKICREELHYPVVIKNFPNTLWIYLPIEDHFFDPKPPAKSSAAPPPQEQQSLQALDVHFENKNFIITYQVKAAQQPPVESTTVYNEEFLRKQQNIQMAILRSFGDVPSTASQDKKIPDFFMVIFADVKRDMEFKTLFYFEDFRRAFANPPGLDGEEYVKRAIIDLAEEPLIAGDYEGKHLLMENISWPEFLRRQMAHRIKFKYQQSDFKPGPDTEKELRTIAQETLRVYDFKDFNAVILQDYSKISTLRP